MSDKYYPSAIVQPMLKAASDIMHELVQFGETLQGENARLTHELNLAKTAAADKVTLEKVAGMSAEKATEFATFLETRGIIPAGTHEKYASACCADANVALEIAMKAIKCSESPSSQGYGVKSASANGNTELEEEMALWKRCLA